jgi:DNA polymerase III, delta subunit
LKCVEEPNAPIQWIFTAHSSREVLPTIVSRCVRIQVPKEVLQFEHTETKDDASERTLNQLFSEVIAGKQHRKDTLTLILRDIPKFAKQLTSLQALDILAFELAKASKQNVLSWVETRTLLAYLRNWKEAEGYNIGVQNLLMKFFLKLRMPE